LISGALDLVPYALIATASPLGLAVTVTVLRTGRVQAFGLAAGVVGGQFLACSVLVIIGAAFAHRVERPHVQAVLEVVVGAALLASAFVIRLRPEQDKPHDEHSHRILERLRRVSLGTSLAAGLALGLGGPKRLVLTSLAATSITATGLDAANKSVLVLWYTALATVVVWGPVVVAAILGPSAVDRVDASLQWLTKHQRGVTFYALLVVSTFLLIHGLLLLSG
jgi:hypothetical protein